MGSILSLQKITIPVIGKTLTGIQLKSVKYDQLYIYYPLRVVKKGRNEYKYPTVFVLEHWQNTCSKFGLKQYYLRTYLYCFSQAKTFASESRGIWSYSTKG